MKFWIFLFIVGCCHLSVTAQNQTVVFRNNTAFNLSFTLDVDVSPSQDDESFVLNNVSIPFYSDNRAISTHNIDDKSIVDSIYQFSITVKSEDDSLEIKYRTILSNGIFSIEASARYLDSNIPFTAISDSNSAILNFAFDDTDLTFKAGKIGNNQYLFLLHDNNQAQLDPSELSDPNVMNVLTYNIFMLPPPIYYSNQWIRARAIPDEILGYDVIIFQEAFMEGINNDIIFEMLKNEYPYQTDPITKIGKPEDSGVYIVSRWPIEESDFIIYNKCSAIDCLSAKGVRYALINKLGVRYHIFGTHADAGDTDAKNFQYQQARKFMDNKTISPYESVLFGGDYNVKYLDPLYFAIQDTLDFIDPNIVGYPWTTTSRRSVIDYVLEFEQYLPSNYSHNNTLILRSTKDEALPIVDLSDHYAVHGHFQFPGIEPEVVFDSSEIVVSENIIYTIATIQERRTKYCIGEYSLDSLNFFSIDTIKTNVFSDQKTIYDFSKDDNAEETLFFRTKIVFQDGSIAYSPVSVLNRITTGVNIESLNEITLTNLIEQYGSIHMIAYSSLGQIVAQEEIHSINDFQKITNLRPGGFQYNIVQFYSPDGMLLGRKKLVY